MFEDPTTIWIEIVALVAIIGFLSTIFGVYLYKKAHHLPTGECACCHKNKKKMLKEYHRYYSSKK